PPAVSAILRCDTLPCRKITSSGHVPLVSGVFVLVSGVFVCVSGVFVLCLRPSGGEVLSWADSLEALLTNQCKKLSVLPVISEGQSLSSDVSLLSVSGWSDGQAVFRHFLRLEFSEENLDFWLAVEKFKKTRPLNKMAARAAKIYEEFISTNATRQVNMDSSVIESTNQSLRLGVSSASFQLAQDQIFGLMETDSYPRFLKSPLYAQLANHNTH
uniref:RGS domain-containing protein n=1 Tax=Amphiprion percula TaxID=161767 RepID=A0A3P8U626_AMPPE